MALFKAQDHIRKVKSRKHFSYVCEANRFLTSQDDPTQPLPHCAYRGLEAHPDSGFRINMTVRAVFFPFTQLSLCPGARLASYRV